LKPVTRGCCTFVLWPVAPIVATRRYSKVRVAAGSADGLKRLTANRRQPLQASHETGHDEDGHDLHRPLDSHGEKVIAHHLADLGEVGIGPA
jgi:hypothetical protein